MNELIIEWYTGNFPNDDVGKGLESSTTFEGMFDTLKNGGDVYDYLGDACDSIIRERLFTQLSKLLKVHYDVVYDLWLFKGKQH